MRWNPHSAWTRSREGAHPALVSDELFDATQDRLEAGRHRGNLRKARSPRSYMLRGLVTCGVCGRRMAGTWNNGQAYYRCNFGKEYATAKALDHPPTVYLREADVVPALDSWLTHWFADEEGADKMVGVLAESQQTTAANDAKVDAARAKIADCDRRFAQYRKA